MKIRTARKICREQDREAHRAWREERPAHYRYTGYQHRRAIIAVNKHIRIPINVANDDGTTERITIGGAANRTVMRVERDMRRMQIG